MQEKKEVCFAAVGDLHCTEDSVGTLRSLFAQASEAADALLLCGDLTDYGTVKEAKILADELTVVSVPVIAVLGNHDYESGVADDVRRTLHAVGVQVLDGEAVEVHGVGIAGAKGFAGGFGRASLGAWGEPAIKQFVNEALHEAMKLESALAKLRTPRRIALLHYAPISGTVQGEPPEIYRLPRQQPARGAVAALSGRLGVARPCAPRRARRANHQRHAGLQRGQAAAAAHVRGPPGIPFAPSVVGARNLRSVQR